MTNELVTTDADMLGTALQNLQDSMSEHEHLLHRIGFLEGAIDAITLYAIWRNGEQWVGGLERPLNKVLLPYREELARLTPKVTAP